LFRNLGNGQFADVTSQAGAVLTNPEVSRGAAFGDIDNDGDTDVVVVNDSGPIRLLINHVGGGKHWVGVRVIGPHGRDMVGARVGITRSSTDARGDLSNVEGRASGPTLWRRARADGSYGSANDPRVLVGLGDTNRVSRVRVEWPGANAEEWTDVPVDRYTTLKQGDADALRATAPTKAR
jgi:hypothetical protein